jgi:hypothetical protein
MAEKPNIAAKVENNGEPTTHRSDIQQRKIFGR